MAEIINLRRARKRRERSDKESAAAANRIRHGRTKAERQTERTIAEQARRTHEGHRRDTDPET